MTKLVKELKAGDVIAMELGTWENKGSFIFKEMAHGKIIVQPCGYYLTEKGTKEKWYGTDREVAITSLKEKFEVVEF